MKKIYKLKNQFKHYEWGSNSFIPLFLNAEKDGLPCAEMWMGTHRGAPSQAEDNGNLVNLADIAGDLPFLFKLIAVETPLSIQVHPDKQQALEGFERENKAGIPLDDQTRSYKDPNPKSEIICALTPFTLAAGFKQTCDCEVYSPSCFNFITLQPGQAVYIPCGVPHSYASGFGLELMNNSDNVVRGGLTNKHVDLREFKRIMNPDVFVPQIITPDSNTHFSYPCPCNDFSLSLIRGTRDTITFMQSEKAVGIVTDGELEINGMRFNKGSSFYIDNDGDQITLKGSFSLYIASAVSNPLSPCAQHFGNKA